MHLPVPPLTLGPCSRRATATNNEKTCYQEKTWTWRTWTWTSAHRGSGDHTRPHRFMGLLLFLLRRRVQCSLAEKRIQGLLSHTQSYRGPTATCNPPQLCDKSRIGRWDGRWGGRVPTKESTGRRGPEPPGPRLTRRPSALSRELVTVNAPYCDPEEKWAKNRWKFAPVRWEHVGAMTAPPPPMSSSPTEGGHVGSDNPPSF